MSTKDYYKILGLERSASADQIRATFKKLAVKYHPDVNKEATAEAKFKEINEAYQVLSDPQKKSQYDQFGHSDFNPHGGGGSGGFSQGFDFSGFQQGADFGDLGDIFNSFFGGRQTRSRKRPGRDIEMIIQLTFEEAVFGVEKKINYSVIDTCSVCHGRGGENLKKCQKCDGQGQITHMARTILGSFSQVATCPECKGRGEVPEIPCRHCHGEGRLRQQKEVTVKIPAGVDDDSSIQISGRGEAGEDGHGDLYLRIKVQPSRQFERDGSDILSEKEISFAQAALGNKIEIETIHGPVMLNVPAGTESHTNFVLRGKGVAHPTNKDRGDHIVTIKIKVPKKLNREERELLEKLKESENN